MYLSTPSSDFDGQRRDKRPPASALASTSQSASDDDFDVGTAMTRLADRARATPPRPSGDRRRATRLPLPNGQLLATIAPATGRPRNAHVFGRDLSSHGLGVLHQSFVHAGTPCRILLPRFEAEAEPVVARVVGCCHARGPWHLLSLRFDRPLDPRVVLGPVAAESAVEQSSLAALAGHVILVDAETLDRRLMRHHLRGTMVTVAEASTPKEAAEQAAAATTAFDLAIVDPRSDDAHEFAEARKSLRDAGVRRIAFCTNHDAPSTRNGDHIGLIGSLATLPKPFTPNAFLSAMMRWLDADSAAGLNAASSIARRRDDDHELRLLLPTAIDELRSVARQLAADADPDAQRRLCRRVKDVASHFGLQHVASVADSAVIAQPAALAPAIHRVAAVLNSVIA